MAQWETFFEEHKKKFVFLGALLIAIILIEVFIFNRGFFYSKLLKLEERYYSVNEGKLFQFEYSNGKLVAQSNDPHITFDNINLPVGAVSIKCINSIPGTVGQVFYRNSNQSFNEPQSVRYAASLTDKTLFLSQILGFPKIMSVTSLRFDLTNIPGDIISCSEFVINPHIPFGLSLVRLSSYVGLFLIAILIVFRNVKPVTYTGSLKVVFISFFLVLSFVLGVKLLPLAITQNVIFIVVLCILLFSLAITYALVYLFIDSKTLQVEKASILEKNKYEIALAALILITILPLLTESYFYYDDWWGVGSETLLTKQNIIAFGRPIQILIYAVFDKINIRNSYMFKWVFLPAIIIYAIVLFRWLRSRTQDNFFSFYLACILSVFSPATDLLGYTATSAVIYSILFSGLSVICFERAYTGYMQREKSSLLINFVLAFALLFLASLTYQIGLQIIFVFLSIDIYFNAEKKLLLKKHLAFLFLFALSIGIYMLFIKFLNWAYLVEITTTRSHMLGSLSQLVEKAHFYKLVVDQSIMQVVAAFTGSGFIMERYRGYFVSFSDQTLGNLFFFFVVMMILIAFLSYWFRTKNFIGLLSLLAFIPMSYFVFLVLSENGYLTYYAFAHISLFMVYFVIGFIESLQFVWKRIKILLNDEGKYSTRDIKPAYIIAPLLVMSALISNFYIRDFYINYNSMVYNFIKYSLQTAIQSGNIKRIHINGLISPINADVYSRFVAETALKDLEENVADYEITFSSNRYFLAHIQEADYMKIRERISEDDKLELDKTYNFDPTYRQYYIKAWPSEDDQEKLQRIFMSAGFIPLSTTPGTLLIDLTWTDSAYFNHPVR